MPATRNDPGGGPGPQLVVPAQNLVRTQDTDQVDIGVVESSVAYWVGRIRPHLDRAAAEIIQAGAELIEAKAAVQHGQFGEVLAGLGIEPRVAQHFMAISRNGVLSNTKHVSLLPPSWGTLAVLAPLGEDVLTEAIDEGLVHPEMTRADAARLVAEDRHHQDDDVDTDVISPDKSFPRSMQDLHPRLVAAGVTEEVLEGWREAAKGHSRVYGRRGLAPASTPPPARRKPLPDRINSAAGDLRRVNDRIEKVLDDDRFPQYKNDLVSRGLRAELARAALLHNRLRHPDPAGQS